MLKLIEGRYNPAIINQKRSDGRVVMALRSGLLEH